MKEISYSQDMIISDANMLATLSVFCKKIYLPYPNVAKDVHWAATGLDDDIVQKIEQAWESDPERSLSSDWKEQHKLLFDENIIDFLPVRFNPKNRHLDNPDDVCKQLYGDTNLRGVTTHLALNHHIIRDDLPGTEFFHGSGKSGIFELPKEFFSLGLPTLSANDDRICELRSKAQQQGIDQFWDMIEEHVKLADAKKESYTTRAEKLRDEFSKWSDDHWKFRGKTLGVIGLTAFSFVNSTVAPLATIAACDWLGDVNRKWAQRKSLNHLGFKFISGLKMRIN